MLIYMFHPLKIPIPIGHKCSKMFDDNIEKTHAFLGIYNTLISLEFNELTYNYSTIRSILSNFFYNALNSIKCNETYI